MKHFVQPPLKIAITTMLLTVSLSYAQSLSIPSEINVDQLLNTIKGSEGSSAQQQDIPEGRQGYLYGLGTGPIDRISLPPVIKVTRDYKANWSAGLGYSCGKFDPFANIEQMVNRAVEKFKQMPQAFVSAAEEAVASLPGYLLNKINPTLYNTVTKNIDDAFELFDIKITSCKDIEAGLANHGNSYFDYFKAAKADRQRVEIGNAGNSETVDEIQNKVDEGGADNGIVAAGGERKGGKDQDPFNATSEIIIAGYNMLIGRTDTTSEDPPQTSDKHPIAQVFKSPKEARDWVVAIYGNREWSLPNEDSKTQSKSGVGMRYQYQAHRYHLLELMQQLVKDEIKREAFVEKTGGIQFAPSELNDLRLLEGYNRDLVIEKRSQEEAIRDMQMRVRFVKEALNAGLEEPSIAQSTAASKIRQEIQELIIRMEHNLYELTQLQEQG